MLLNNIIMYCSVYFVIQMRIVGRCEQQVSLRHNTKIFLPQNLRDICQYGKRCVIIFCRKPPSRWSQRKLAFKVKEHQCRAFLIEDNFSICKRNTHLLFLFTNSIVCRDTFTPILSLTIMHCLKLTPIIFYCHISGYSSIFIVLLKSMSS